MIQLNMCQDSDAVASAQLVLPYEKRQKSRLKVCLEDGTEAALIIPRGTILRNGSLLQSKEGLVVRICAAEEEVSKVESTDHLMVTRAAYHLGNRHVPIEIGKGWLRYQRDHVLDHMVESLGLSVQYELSPFEPESGAYGAHSHNHS